MTNNRRQLVELLLKKELILFGAGNYAGQFYKDFHDTLQIMHCISNNKNEEALMVDGREVCPVRRAESCVITDDQMVILCAERYQEMDKQLRDMGYKYGVHYIDSGIARLLFSDKQIVLFYGVCYMRALCNCLVESEEFKNKYEAFYWLDYRKMEPEEYNLYSCLLSICDIFLYTVCISYEKSLRNQAYLSRLPKHCKVVKVPLITFTGYHPRTAGILGEENPYHIISDKTYYGTFSTVDCNINQMIDEGKSGGEIVAILKDINFYKKEWVVQNYSREIRKLQIAENLADISFVDYLRENHGRERLFLNETHISNYVIIELAKRILEFIGLNRELPEDRLKEKRLLYTTEVPIYPSVIEHLNLKNYMDHPKYRLFTFGDEREVSFEEYVEQYYAFCLSMKKWKEMGYFP